jgi:hypothetical protein
VSGRIEDLLEDILSELRGIRRALDRPVMNTDGLTPRSLGALGPPVCVHQCEELGTHKDCPVHR